MATSIIKQEFNTVDLGGTGATNAADARENLDVYSKSEVTNLISQSTAQGHLGSGNSVTITPNQDGAHVVILMRKVVPFYIVLIYDFWAEGYIVISGELPSTVTVTKPAGSRTVTITNNIGSSIAYLVK